MSLDSTRTKAILFDLNGNVLIGQKTSAGSIPVVNSSEQEILFSNSLWERETLAGKGFVINVPPITFAGTSENDMFLLKNPNASGKTVRFNRMTMSILKGVSTITGSFRIYRAPTITANGTALTIQKLRSSQAASSVCTAFSVPTISARGTLVEKFTIGNNISQIEKNWGLGFYLEPNSNILVTFLGESTNEVATLTTDFIEV